MQSDRVPIGCFLTVGSREQGLGLRMYASHVSLRWQHGVEWVVGRGFWWLAAGLPSASCSVTSNGISLHVREQGSRTTGKDANSVNRAAEPAQLLHGARCWPMSFPSKVGYRMHAVCLSVSHSPYCLSQARCYRLFVHGRNSVVHMLYKP